MYKKKLQVTTAAVGLMSIVSVVSANADPLSGSISVDANSHFISGSSAESVGEFRLWQVPELVKQ
ncbi:MAG: hypothetical protein O3A87_05495, partial [Verrucomicrobia bacterium]|nr:hypothetical protein [Verrucomicrobiota bacterium]